MGTRQEAKSTVVVWRSDKVIDAVKTAGNIVRDAGIDDIDLRDRAFARRGGWNGIHLGRRGVTGYDTVDIFNITISTTSIFNLLDRVNAAAERGSYRIFSEESV